jgi:hypothetical protein
MTFVAESIAGFGGGSAPGLLQGCKRRATAAYAIGTSCSN